MKIIRHIIVIASALFIMLGIPFLRSDKFMEINGADSVSSASVAVDKPSGEYIIFINKSLHADSVEMWEKFFREGNTENMYSVFEDIECTAAKGDPSGFEMADSFRSQLPENQMKIKKEDAVLMLSKAENGIFDVIIMSKEFSDAYSAERISEKNDVCVISVKGENA